MWPESEEGLNKLHQQYKPRYPIHIRTEQRRTPFFRHTNKKTVDKIEIDIYYKPTDSYNIYYSIHVTPSM